MTARSPGAFLLSATFHAALVAVLFFFAMVSGQSEKTPTKVLELVAGEGDNFGATVAPALGTPGGVKLKIPEVPKPEPKAEPAPEPPAPPMPEPPKPAPITPVPPPKPVEQPIPNFAKQIRRKINVADAKAKQQIAKERAAEEKRLKKEEFDRLQRERAKAASNTKAGTPKIAKIDAEGIAKGVIGGSTENKVGGAGGRALVATEGALTERYFAMLKQRVLNALEKPPGVSDDLTVTVVVHISPNGRLSGARVVRSSGSDEFDRAVIAAFSRVEMPEHPERKNEDLELTFRTRDAGQG